jgi:DNA-binding transcriptional ArsR family regulator
MQRPLRLDEVEALFASPALVVDACRHAVRRDGTLVELARRPVLFALARALAEAWPGDVSRQDLVRLAFRGREADESHRARLRVEIGRLRAALHALAGIAATGRGFVLQPRGGSKVVLLARPVEEPHGMLLALLSDGEAWSSSALALAVGASQRSVQRVLEALAEAGKVNAIGRGRSLRWITPPMPGIATSLLLPAPLPGG